MPFSRLPPFEAYLTFQEEQRDGGHLHATDIANGTLLMEPTDCGYWVFARVGCLHLNSFPIGISELLTVGASKYVPLHVGDKVVMLAR